MYGERSLISQNGAEGQQIGGAVMGEVQQSVDLWPILCLHLFPLRCLSAVVTPAADLRTGC